MGIGIKRRKILVFGNPLLPEDSLPIRLMGRLKKMFPDIDFVEFDPNDNIEYEGRTLEIIDTVADINKVMIITDIDSIKMPPRYSMHDFDLGSTLKLLKKMGYLDKVRIFGMPMRIREDDALSQLCVLISGSSAPAKV